MCIRLLLCLRFNKEAPESSVYWQPHIGGSYHLTGWYWFRYILWWFEHFDHIFLKTIVLSVYTCVIGTSSACSSSLFPSLGSILWLFNWSTNFQSLCDVLHFHILCALWSNKGRYNRYWLAKSTTCIISLTRIEKWKVQLFCYNTS